MKPKFQRSLPHPVLAALTACLAATCLTQDANAAAFTWDGGTDANLNWSDGENWGGDTAPGATGNTLTFAGTTNVSAINDSLTALATSGTAITFASGAGSFDLSGNSLTVGSGGGGGQVIIQQNSASDQTISLNLNFSGGSGDRSIVFGSGAGSLTLSGNINFSNDWLFPNTTAGTIILSGNNTGDGKAYNAGGITAGTNTMNAMMRNNVAGTQLVLGSDTALGNSGSGTASAGTASFRGIVANQQLNISTTGGDRNLSGSSLSINANNITFNGSDNLTIGNLINQGGNRDFNVSSTGAVSVSNGLFLSQDQNGRNLYVNLSGAGGMVVNGVIADTFHSGGVTSGTSTLRKAGTGTMILNGNSSGYLGLVTIEAGTLKIGHANALGATGTGSGTTLSGNGILDLNGITSGETLTINSSSSKILNSSASAGGLSADATLNTNLTIDATGNIAAARLIGNGGTRTVTKLGAGTLTTGGTSHNNLISWDVQAGKLVLANTSGYGADRAVTINGGTLQLGGSNSNLINDNEAFTLNSGVFDLNGKSEAVASIGGSGGTIRNTLAASTSTLYVGGGGSGSSSASFAGVIENGSGTLKLTKEGSGTQTLTGINTYTGATTISGGTLAIGTGGSIASSSGVVLNSGNFNVSAVSGFAIGASQSLTGSGSVTGAITINGNLSIGASPGTIIFNDDLAFAGGSTSDFQFTLPTFTLGSFDLAVGGAGTPGVTFGGSLNLLFDSGETYANGSSLQIFNFETFGGSFSTVNFSGLGAGQAATFDSSTGYVTVVPEPGAILLGGIGMLMILRRRKI